MSTSPDPVVILSAARTPLGRFMGELSPFSAHKLGAHVIGAALEPTIFTHLQGRFPCSVFRSLNR
ncbi:acetyl-CoA acetyltransferase [Bradyrhizobium sp. AZCC 2262]